MGRDMRGVPDDIAAAPILTDPITAAGGDGRWPQLDSTTLARAVDDTRDPTNRVWQHAISEPHFTYWNGVDDETAHLCPNQHTCAECPRYSSDLVEATIGTAVDFFSGIREKFDSGGDDATTARNPFPSVRSLLEWRPGGADKPVVIDDIDVSATPLYGWWGGRPAQDTYIDGRPADMTRADATLHASLPRGYRGGPGARAPSHRVIELPESLGGESMSRHGSVVV